MLQAQWLKPGFEVGTATDLYVGQGSVYCLYIHGMCRAPILQALRPR